MVRWPASGVSCLCCVPCARRRCGPDSGLRMRCALDATCGTQFLGRTAHLGFGSVTCRSRARGGRVQSSLVHTRAALGNMRKLLTVRHALKHHDERPLYVGAVAHLSTREHAHHSGASSDRRLPLPKVAEGDGMAVSPLSRLLRRRLVQAHLVNVLARLISRADALESTERRVRRGSRRGASVRGGRGPCDVCLALAQPSLPLRVVSARCGFQRSATILAARGGLRGRWPCCPRWCTAHERRLVCAVAAVAHAVTDARCGDCTRWLATAKHVALADEVPKIRRRPSTCGIQHARASSSVWLVGPIRTVAIVIVYALWRNRQHGPTANGRAAHCAGASLGIAIRSGASAGTRMV